MGGHRPEPAGGAHRDTRRLPLVSRKITAIHEWFHVLGGVDANNRASLRSGIYPHLGDAAENKWIPTPDAVEAVRGKYAAASPAGVNFTLWNFRDLLTVDNGDRHTKEGWNADFQQTDDPDLLGGLIPDPAYRAWDEQWFIERNYTYGSDGSAAGSLTRKRCRRPTTFVAGLLESTVGAARDVDIRLGLTNDQTTCELVIWQNSWRLTSGVPLRVQTSPSDADVITVPVGASNGNYYLCALVDPANAIVETREDDNLIISDLRFEVKAAGITPMCC